MTHGGFIDKVAVIGAGSWGSTVAHLLGQTGVEVGLWAHGEETVEGINTTGYNPRYISDVKLEGVHASTRFDEVLEDAQALVMVTPSSNVREVAGALAPFVAHDLPVIMLSKGVEADTGALMTDILSQELENASRIAALSGPNHAEEICHRLPAAAVVASSSPDTAAFFQQLFTTDYFRVYTSDDVTGVELCAASKNVVAIACGIAAGLEYGDNTASLIMTRGLAEMSRLVSACGGKTLTCMGLAGMGDLIATCSSTHSRNRSLGALIAQGGTLDEFTERTHMVAEGAVACRTVTQLAASKGIELPLATMVNAVLWEGLDPREAGKSLLTRARKDELAGIENDYYEG